MAGIVLIPLGRRKKPPRLADWLVKKPENVTLFHFETMSRTHVSIFRAPSEENPLQNRLVDYLLEFLRMFPAEWLAQNNIYDKIRSALIDLARWKRICSCSVCNELAVFCQLNNWCTERTPNKAQANKSLVRFSREADLIRDVHPFIVDVMMDFIRAFGK